MRWYRWDSLSELIKKFSAKSGIEIGVQRGINMSHLLRRHKDLRLIGIDGWELLEPVVGSEFSRAEQLEHYRTAKIAANEFGERSQLIKELSWKAAQNIEDHSVDFVFIDGDHSYEGAKADIDLWASKVKQGGFICGHDYESPYYPGVTDAVNEQFDNVNALDCSQEKSKVWWVAV